MRHATAGSSRRGVAAGLLGLALVSAALGCVRYQARPLAAERTGEALERRTLADPALLAFVAAHLPAPPGEPAPAGWDLARLTLAALYYHPELDVARAEWAAAAAARIAAGERPNPVLALTPGYSTTTSNPSPWLALVNLDLTIETGGKRAARQAQAAALDRAAQLDLAAAAWRVRSRVRAALLALHAARESAALQERQQALQEESLGIQERQRAAGALSGFQLGQARIGADATRLALDEARRRAGEAEADLAAAIGVPRAALAETSFSFGDLEGLPAEANLAPARRQAILDRADLLAELARYAASEAALRLEIAKQYPDLHLGPGYEYDQGNEKWSLGFTVALPVFSRNRGAIAEAEARRQEAAAKFEARQASVLAAVDRAAASLRGATATLEEATSTRDRLEQQERTARSLHDAGEISLVDLDALRLQLGAAILARLEARIRVEEAAGALEDALQGPLGLSPAAWEIAPRVAAAPGSEERP